MTMHALKNSDRITEGNPFLNERPSNRALLAHKLIIAPLVEQNMNYYQMEVLNIALEIAIIRNIYVMDKVSAW